ncbi:MAG: glycosyltransferase family 4 protein [Verrucomicrobiales bacterium]|nr:glycosyltransferase family 4 protein [Verrucomicrobiales bacterium]
MTRPRVVQTSIGLFHHFDLARQMERLGLLEAIFTGYPRWKLRDAGLPPEKVKTFPWLQAFYLAKDRMGLNAPWLDCALAWRSLELLDSHVARQLPECNVFIGLSGAGLRTGRVARQRGARHICDRGSSHIRLQDQILRDEFRRWGQLFPGVDERIAGKEEAEYAEADQITVASEFALKSFIARGVPAERLRKIPYGVELDRFERVADPERDCFRILAVGQVSFRKGFPYLLEAFQKLNHPRKQLRLVGAVQPEIRTWLRGRATEKVEFAGAQPQRDLPALMSRAHVLVLASVEDGFGLVLAQAMACGCPVIATEHTGGPDMITNGIEGFVVPIRDSTALADRLEQLGQDSDLRGKMSEAAVERVKRCGGWNDYGEAFARLCLELAARRN